jgi:multidrug resistance protein, MATE family
MYASGARVDICYPFTPGSAGLAIMTALGSELRLLTRLSAPVALTQLGLMLTGVVDLLMVARVEPEALAACALGNMWQWSFMSMGMGLVLGSDPLIAQAHGRGDGPGTALAFQRGLLVAVLASVPVTAALALTGPGLELLGQAPSVAAKAWEYNLCKLPTVPCFLVYSALRQFLQGRTIMAPATWVMWIGNLLHVPLNALLIFGLLGLPRLGLNGAAISSAITTLFLVTCLWTWMRVFRLYEGAERRWDRESFALPGLIQVARLGLPVGLQMSLEAWAFAWATMMAGWISIDAVGGHQIALNLASLAFMVPLGISQGASTRVGNLIGSGDSSGLRRAVTASLLLGGGVMTASAASFAIFRRELPLLYSDDATVAAIATQILPLAAAFQLSDGVQVVAGGVLRGMGRPDASAIVNLVGYYAFALPLAYLLGFHLHWGLWGIWAALCIGLLAVAAALTIWARRISHLPLAHLQLTLRRN